MASRTRYPTLRFNSLAYAMDRIALDRARGKEREKLLAEVQEKLKAAGVQLDQKEE